MSSFITIPDAPALLLRNAGLMQCFTGHNGDERRDLRIVDGRIVEVGVGLEQAPGEAGIDLDGSLVFPCFADLHTHIDKGHIWKRAANRDGTHQSAFMAVRTDREANWTARDVMARADFALRCAYAYGTSALRTHIDTAGPQLEISWPVFAELRARWEGRIDLQAASIVPLEMYGLDWADHMACRVAEHGGLLGGAAILQPDAASLIGRLFDLAEKYDLDIDLHTDETGDPAAHTLRLVAEATIARGYQGRVTCGHCCSLAAQDVTFAARTIELVAQADIAIVSLPVVNLYLQGRIAGGTPRLRGVTLLHELKSAGVRVAIASDNTRDPFHRYGDLDMLETLRESVRIAHLDTPLGDWPLAATRAPLSAMKRELSAHDGMIAAGGAADLILFNARDDTELFSRPQSDRVVLRQGRTIDTALPGYRELDIILAR